MSPQRFDIVAPGKWARMFPLLIGLALPIALLAVMALEKPQGHDWLTSTPAIVVLPLVGLFLARRIHRPSVCLLDAGLQLGALPWRRVPVSAMDLAQARVVNLDELREWQPVLRIAGASLPGYRSGLFRLRNGRRARILLTDRRRVLLLPRLDGGAVLLSLTRPEALLAALRNQAG